MPKSRARAKAVYTPPARSSKAKVSPPWLAPTMTGCLVLGLGWIATYYITNSAWPIAAIAAWNLAIGFVFIIAGVVLATKWH